MAVLHWLIVVVFSATYFIPAVRIVQRTGYSGWWVLLTLVPVVNIVMFWVFAFTRWPAVDRT